MPDSLTTLLNDMVEAGRTDRTRHGRPISRTHFLEEIWRYPRGSFWRLRRNPNPRLGSLRPYFIDLLRHCPSEARSAFKDRWDLLNLKLADAVSATEGQSWANLAQALAATGSWPPQPHEVSAVITNYVEATRIHAGERAALRNALILLRGAFDAGRTGGRDDRLILLSLTFPALDLAGVTGHGPSLLLLRDLLRHLHANHTDDPQIARLRLDCDAIVLSHFGRPTRVLLREAAATHHAEMQIVERQKTERYLAQEWPIVYRGGLGAHYNFINTKVRLGEITSEANPFYKQWRDTTDLMNELSLRRSHETVNGRVRTERDPFLARLRADILLQRDRRNTTLSGGKPREAIAMVDGVLIFHAAEPYLSDLEAASLLGLRAEALLCIWHQTRQFRDRDAYWEARTTAFTAARAALAKDEPPRWAKRLMRLERVADIS